MASKVSQRAAKRKARNIRALEDESIREHGGNIASLAGLGADVGGELGEKIAKRGPATRALQNIRGGAKKGTYPYKRKKEE